ncbi:MAG: hypothetical protein IPO58_08385 [Betaproteobacteria bacterium]|nr:hypothetical protein [Betaproteobacteria bacterium]
MNRPLLIGTVGNVLLLRKAPFDAASHNERLSAHVPLTGRPPLVSLPW